MIVRDAYRFLVPLAVFALLGFILKLTVIGLLMSALFVFVAFFFRNPHRSIPADPQAIVSPADGKVVRLERVGNVTRLSIFLSLFDVHVNRSPIAGRIEAIDYRPGKFMVAFNDKASTDNERNIIMVNDGRITIVFTQIAGIVARRIVCWKKPGDVVGKGELVGLIRFGSRVDVLFPAGTEATVSVGDRVKGGSTRIGLIKERNG
ncbi:MAG TPA: phosphatidylserine decarboxylase family protein [Terriglobia bacterium]|nr:phosphatidylserine decarboxylase family protein [Terriglobia bacterium]